MNDPELKRTALHGVHVEAGARLVPFAGWEMPVQYRGVMEEHRAVRAAAGLFDVSHMGEFRVRGEGAEAFLQWLTPNDVSALKKGRAHYSALLDSDGCYLDDLLVYRLAADDFLLVVNAANVASDFEWVDGHAPRGLTVENVSERYALLALQGPRALGILQETTETSLDKIRYYGFKRGRVDGHRALISRTGYTGEDGFELYIAPEAAEPIWCALMATGAEQGLLEAGLGARDTLRLEAGMALYGHELDAKTRPWEAQLAWTVKMAKGDFLGREALVAARAEAPARALVGFEVTGRGIAREACEILVGEQSIGRVTSGTFSPTLEKAIGMAYVATANSAVGSTFEIEVRGRRLPARVVSLPFYSRKR